MSHPFKDIVSGWYFQEILFSKDFKFCLKKSANKYVLDSDIIFGCVLFTKNVAIG